MKKLLVLFCLSLFLLLANRQAKGIYDPISVPNNRFGIHIVSEVDLGNAAQLVNSSGGKWGYVALVIRQDEQNVGYWQEIFKKTNRLKLIPIIRLATQAQGDYWQKPELEQAESWANFLDQLPWPTQNRYVVIFNEPNHAKEWGQEINPAEYGAIFKEYASKLKEKSRDFFILPAGLDASASNHPGSTLDEVTFLSQMTNAQPDFFDYLDGWTSHSYPQPDFKGSPNDSGRGTVKTYLWELNLLENLGLNRQLPVFITETGWNQRGISTDTLVSHYQTAFKTVWDDPQIVAIIPFLLNYQGEPFADFSWQVLGATTFQPHYYTVQALTKTTGEPKQKHQVEILNRFPNQLVAKTTYNLSLKITNQGQSIISPEDGFEVRIETTPQLDLHLGLLPTIEPGETKELKINFTPSGEDKIYQIKYWLARKSQAVSPTRQQILKVFPLLSLKGFMVWLKLIK